MVVPYSLSLIPYLSPTAFSAWRSRYLKCPLPHHVTRPAEQSEFLFSLIKTSPVHYTNKAIFTPHLRKDQSKVILLNITAIRYSLNICLISLTKNVIFINISHK